MNGIQARGFGGTLLLAIEIFVGAIIVRWGWDFGGVLWRKLF